MKNESQDLDLLIHEFVHPPTGEKMYIPKGFVPMIRAYNDWNALMPVAKKIIDWRSTTEGILHDADLLMSIFSSLSSVDFERAKQSVVEYILWYNSFHNHQPA